MRWACVAVLVTGFVAPTASAQAWRDPWRVLVIYSTTFPDNDGDGTGDSLQVAQLYQTYRGVPAQNLLGIACSTATDTWSTWTSFFNELRNPLVAALGTLGPGNIDTLLFCHGVPFRVLAGSFGSRSVDQTCRTPFYLQSTPTNLATYWYGSPYFEGSPGVGADLGHFSHSFGFGGQWFYLAARLDGPDVDATLDQLEGARYGDRHLAASPGFYRGNAYVDTRFSTYANVAQLAYPQFHSPSYGNADEDMAWGVQWMWASGFPVRWENTATDLEIGQGGATFSDGSPATSAPDAMFYFGWYNYAVYHDVWEWLPGSAACDLNSNSIAGIRSVAPGSFLGTALRRGLSCGAGCIDEPYLTGHPFPEVFIKRLIDGFTFAEAANSCDPTHAWRSLYVGDPLYAPLRAGKVAIVDVTPPPPAAVVPLSSSPGTASFRAARMAFAPEPDLVTVGGPFGPAPTLGSALPHQRPFRTSPVFTLGGLVPGAFHRAQLEMRDPAGNATPLPELLIWNDGSSSLAVKAQAGAATVAAGQPVAVEFALRVPAGTPPLGLLSLTADVPSLGVTGIDLWPIVPLLAPQTHGSATSSPLVVSLELTIPPLPPGTYVFRVQAAAGALQVQDAVTVTVL